ncbi:MAG TPA: glutathione synthase [Polyangiaceae bacterium]|nr:glutathione synthase [Polyangiaceae bacterium]
MRLLFIMDPYAGMLPDKDTSFAFMRGAGQRGHQCFHALPTDISNEGTRVSARARSIAVSDVAPHVSVGEPDFMALETFDAVFVRKDPPFDSAYLHLTQQLDLVTKDVLVINAPRALRDANEKLYTFQFPEFMPRTLVTASTEQMMAFIRAVGGKAVVKPLDGAGGSGVMGIDIDNRTTRGILDYANNEGRRLALVQEFKPEIVGGDKRVLIIDGTLIGAIRRVPRADDIRANIHVGGRVEACELTPRERELVSVVGKRLGAEGLYFVGLDLIGEQLIEVNVTSPTGMQELGRLTGTAPELEVIRWLERRLGVN